jgi:hypothetical protein
MKARLWNTPIESALLGSWSATRWQYTSRERPDAVVDLVCGLGGSVTLSLSAETYVLTWSSAGQDGRSIGGVLAIEGDRIALRAQDASETEAVTYRLAGETLALSSDASRWDFDGDGAEEAADFVAVLVRL